MPVPSIAVRVTLEQMRSIPSLTGDGKTTPDAKIVRFIVDEDNGGTGIHLVDELKQDHSWFQSWANRRTYIGPFATNYDLWVKPIKGTTPTKVKDFPANANTNYQHRDKYGIDIGVNGRLQELRLVKTDPRSAAKSPDHLVYPMRKR